MATLHKVYNIRIKYYKFVSRSLYLILMNISDIFIKKMKLAIQFINVEGFGSAKLVDTALIRLMTNV